MSVSKHLIAIIGAGPAGIFAANQLANAGHEVVIINRDVKPGGLAEYGIYYTKYRMKEGLRQQFHKIFSNENIHYFGNVTIGTRADISLDDLRQLGFDAILVTVGAQGTKWLGLPGEFLAGVYHAKDLVYHYNQLPPYSQRNYEIGKRVALIGIGNVMTDIARWLIHDIKVDEVIALARRGPAEVKFAKKEMESIICNLDMKAFDAELQRSAPAMEAIGQDVNEAKAYILSALPDACDATSHTRFLIRFLSAPSAILDAGDGRACGLEVDETILLRRDDEIFAKPTGNRHVEDVDTVVFCIGDRVDEGFGLPVKWNEYVKNPKPRFPIEGNSYETYDLQTNSPIEGVFVAGWARKASDGLVGIARKDGENGAKAVLAYLDTIVHPPGAKDVLAEFEERLRQVGKPFVTTMDWLRLEEIEKQEAERHQLPAFRFNTNEEMLSAIGLVLQTFIRPLRTTDMAEWMRLRIDLWPLCSVQVHEQEMDDIIINPHEATVFVSPKTGGGLNGFIEIGIRAYAEGCTTNRVGYIDGVYVEPEIRQRGIGRALMTAAESWARSKGCREMGSNVEVENLTSQYIHKRLGYKEAERLVHFRKNLL
ncbi:MAG: GNAT family N-acetyltransferase [Chloroflexota bacterium]